MFFSPLWTTSWVFWHFGETFAGIVPASKFCLVGGALFSAGALQKMGLVENFFSICFFFLGSSLLEDYRDDEDDDEDDKT